MTIDDEIELPPMDPTANPSTYRYEMHFLLNSENVLPTVKNLRPKRAKTGRLQLNAMQERQLHAPLHPGTPTRAEVRLRPSQ